MPQVHDNTHCDGSVDCTYKDPVQLSKDDVSRVLVDLSKEEAGAMKKYHDLCTWHVQSKWSHLVQKGKYYI